MLVAMSVFSGRIESSDTSTGSMLRKPEAMDFV